MQKKIKIQVSLNEKIKINQLLNKHLAWCLIKILKRSLLMNR